MQQAEIPENDWVFVEWTINIESSWNPYAVEPTTGACHLEQSNPCGKDGCGVDDNVCQLRWADNYTRNRYGSWANEVAFHKINGYY